MTNNEEETLFQQTIALVINDSTIVTVNDSQINDFPSPNLGSLGLLHDEMSRPNSYESDDSFVLDLLTGNLNDDEISSEDSFSLSFPSKYYHYEVYKI